MTYKEAQVALLLLGWKPSDYEKSTVQWQKGKKYVLIYQRGYAPYPYSKHFKYYAELGKSKHVFFTTYQEGITYLSSHDI